MHRFLRDLRPIFPYLRRYRRAYVIGFVAAVLATAFQLTAPWLLKFAVDELTHGAHPRRLAVYAGALVGVTALSGVFRYLMRMRMIGASRWIEYDLRNDYFSQLQRMSPSFYQRWRTGDLMARATNDLNAVRSMVGPGIMHMGATLLVAVAAIAQMVGIDAVLAAAALLPLPAISLVVFRLMRRIRHIFDRIQAQYSRISDKVQENIAGIRIVKSYVSERREIDRFTQINEEYVRRNLKLAKVRGSLIGTIEALAGFGMLFILWVGGYRVIGGQVSLGDLVAFMSFLIMLAWPMIALGWTMNLMQQGRASLLRIQQVFAEKPEITDGEHTDQSISSLHGEIRFEGVEFSYDGVPVLRGIDLHIPSGCTVGIVGRTGSGKTTLLNLIPRLYDPSAGRLLIDGFDARTIPLAILRRHIAIVPQDTFLFSDTLKANIAFGAPEADEDRIRWAAEMAELTGEIETLPNGFDTMLGERGINLSGGQKQRVALARALVRDPTILILDDALSAVDANTEERILRNLKGIMRNRTTLVASHRISAVKDLDLILVLDDGQILERGTHEELLSLRGLYWELYQMQLLEDSLAQM